MKIDYPKTVAVILAAGSGTRMNAKVPKQQMVLAGHTVLYHTAAAFQQAETVCAVIVVVRADEVAFAEKEVSGFDKVVSVVVGGATRMESAERGLNALPQDAAFVAFHDAARCLVTPALIDAVNVAAYENVAATAVSLVTDTVKEVSADGKIVRTVSRDALRAAETPQVFGVPQYRLAMLYAKNAELTLTDDCQLFERMGLPVATVVSQTPNLKITTQNDLRYASFLLETRAKS